jgi:hypothetical protein
MLLRVWDCAQLSTTRIGRSLHRLCVACVRLGSREELGKSIFVSRAIRRMHDLLDHMQTQAPVAFKLRFVEELVGCRLVRKKRIRCRVVLHIRGLVSVDRWLDINQNAIRRFRSVDCGIADAGNGAVFAAMPWRWQLVGGHRHGRIVEIDRNAEIDAYLAYRVGQSPDQAANSVISGARRCGVGKFVENCNDSQMSVTIARGSMEHEPAVRNLAVESYLLGEMSPAERNRLKSTILNAPSARRTFAPPRNS